MDKRCLIFALLLSCPVEAQNQAEQPNPAAAAPAAPPLIACPAGGPLGSVDLRVQGNGPPLPFRTINHLTEGDTLLYNPVLRGKEKRPGEIALVLVPQKRQPGGEDIVVTDPKPANKPQEWKMTQTISIAALVYGPAGLSRRNVARFLSQDEVLVAQLADYAAKTAQAEQLVSTLSNSSSSSASVNAALNGFASEYGFAIQVDRTASPQTQASTVFAAMNPQLANYNPLASSVTTSAAQTASLATMAATLFFGSPVGLAAGGTTMLLNLRSIAFPDTQFRASFAQSLQGSTVDLCGQQGAAPPHSRVAYIWANRIPTIATPAIHIGKADFIPTSEKTPVPVEAPEAAWKYLDRVREWALENEQHNKTPVSVAVLANQKALEIDLVKAHLAPGDYKLTGSWDWTSFEATGALHVLAMGDFKSAHLEPASQDRLLAKSGKVPVTVAGSDFEFTTKVELRKSNDEFAVPETVRFLLPKGLREGPQDHMDVQVDAEDLEPGAYELRISQQDGKNHPVAFKVLPNPPKIDNLPIIVNQGVGTQHFVLRGERLELLTKLEASGAVLTLSSPASSETERSVTVELKSAQQPGTEVAVNAFLRDRSEPMVFPDALQITGPLPVIASSRLSLPAGMAIAVRPEEFPAGYTLNALLDVKNIERTSVLRLGCTGGVGESARLTIGEQTARWNLQQLSADQLFLAFDTSGIPAGCSLQAEIDNGRGGRSRPFILAHILSMPQIDSISVGRDQPQNGLRRYQLTGTNLEMIGMLGWDDKTPVDVVNLPTPLAGQGLRQSIEIHLPDPADPVASLNIWLRGDQQSRLSTIKAPALPAPPEPVAPPVVDTPATPMQN